MMGGASVATIALRPSAKRGPGGHAVPRELRSPARATLQADGNLNTPPRAVTHLVKADQAMVSTMKGGLSARSRKAASRAAYTGCTNRRVLKSYAIAPRTGENQIASHTGSLHGGAGRNDIRAVAATSSLIVIRTLTPM
jgi:hypothetical protein